VRKPEAEWPMDAAPARSYSVRCGNVRMNGQAHLCVRELPKASRDTAELVLVRQIPTEK